MIVGVFLSILIPLVSSHDICPLDTRELVDLKETLEKSAENMKGLTDHKEDAVICLGAARAGKSTLVNYLIGNELKGVCRGLLCSISKANPTSKGPEIGDSSVSLTKEPSKWSSSRLQNLVIWDTPGFGDNRGVQQDTINSFYIYNLVKSVRSAKFILVIDFNDFSSDNSDSFLTTLNNLENFFGTKFPDFFQSISLIITKAPKKINSNLARIDHPYIKFRLENTFLSSEIAMSENVKSYLQYLANNIEQTGVFRKMTEAGEIKGGIDYQIFPAIRHSISQANYTQDIHPSISEKTRNVLYTCHSFLFSMASTAHLSELVYDLFSEESLKYETDARIREINQNLMKIENNILRCVQNETKMDEVLSTISLIDESLKNNIDRNDYNKKFQLLRFFDYLLNFNAAEQIEAIFKAVLWKVIHYINVHKIRIDDVLHKRTLQQHNEKIKKLKEDNLVHVTKLTEEIDRLKAQNNGDLLDNLFLTILNSIKMFIKQLQS